MKNLAKYIDHTLLKPSATKDQIKKLCAEAKKHDFFGVCVNLCHLKTVVDELKGTNVSPVAVVGFPLGATLSQVKAFEAKEAISSGAKEIDMVINIGALKDQDHDLVLNDIKTVVSASAPYPVKVIIETSELTQEEKIQACKIAKSAGAHFVKTSTGFAKAGATIEDVKLMRETVGPDMGVKASGGIKTKEQAIAMIEAGANRLGTSISVEIVT